MLLLLCGLWMWFGMLGLYIQYVGPAFWIVSAILRAAAVAIVPKSLCCHCVLSESFRGQQMVNKGTFSVRLTNYKHTMIVSTH